MPKAVIMPRLDIDMEKGSVVEWRKREGERVEAGEVIAVVMSEKVTYEVESPASGVLAKVLVEPEVEVPIGTPIAVVAEEGDTREEVEEAVREAEEELKKALGLALRAPAPAPRPALALEVRRPEGPRRIKITPVARKLAEQYGIDVTKIRGTGPGGRITKRDVLRALEELKAKPAYREVRLTGIRRLTAEKMVAAWEAPHASLTVEVDM
ncbi:MAG TPA: 2-oxo acid dehydrogenase subunit E2, partial [Candidatus Bathyarchaeota archaeon]|nr:2-oxo acid dehydrogenase subunit E2 [Candidatus Bathyarchaeota archaeon]